MIARICPLFALMLVMTGCSRLSRWEQFYASGKQAEKEQNYTLASQLYASGVTDARALGVQPKEYLPILIAQGKVSKNVAVWRDVIKTATSVGEFSAATDAYTAMHWHLFNHREMVEARDVAQEFASFSEKQVGRNSQQFASAVWDEAADDVRLKRPADALRECGEIEQILTTLKAFDNAAASKLANLRAEAFDQLGRGKQSLEQQRMAVAKADPQTQNFQRQRLIALLHKYGYDQEAHQQFDAYVRASDASFVGRPKFEDVANAAL